MPGLGALRAKAPQLMRFGMVGVLNTVVDLGVLNALLFALAHGDTHVRLFPVFATVSFCCATLNSFYWNRRWTFKAESAGGASELSRFYAVTIGSFVVNVGLSTFLVWWMPFPSLNPTLSANAAKVLATGVSLLLNFVGYDRLVFRKA